MERMDAGGAWAEDGREAGSESGGGVSNGHANTGAAAPPAPSAGSAAGADAAAAVAAAAARAPGPPPVSVLAHHASRAELAGRLRVVLGEQVRLFCAHACFREDREEERQGEGEGEKGKGTRKKMLRGRNRSWSVCTYACAQGSMHACMHACCCCFFLPARACRHTFSCCSFSFQRVHACIPSSAAGLPPHTCMQYMHERPRAFTLM
eukprot:349641-Chlamydomonas_euryale.AAC.22